MIYQTDTKCVILQGLVEFSTPGLQNFSHKRHYVHEGCN
jgi:hypothetical protein